MKAVTVAPGTAGSVSADALATDVVLKNIALFGSVNANRRREPDDIKVVTEFAQP